MQSAPGSDASSGGRLVTADGRTLPLRGATLTAEAQGGLARVVLAQRFENPYDEPLEVTYLMPLPADGAVSGYAFTIGGRRVVGEVDRRQAARERYEQALADGRSAGIVEQERSSLFTQALGNLPPRAEVIAEITVDQRLAWLEEGAWEWRFPTAAGPRYQGAEGRVGDARRIEVAVADRPLEVRLALALTIRDPIAEGRRPESPAHPLRIEPMPDGCRVALAEGGVRLDRDVVVRWPQAAPRVGLGLSLGRPPVGRGASDGAYALLTLVPPAGSVASRRRDLILLLDTSGSMDGAPLRQVKKVCAALVDSLDEGDRLEMIEFSTNARRYRRGAVAAGPREKESAKKWLAGLRAGGGTEMVRGVMEALQPLDADAQRQVVLLTDGYIGFETEVVRAISDQLPRGSRLHVVGVGSAVNRSLTAPSARAGRGLEVVIGIDEDPERAARRLEARTAAPLVTDLAVEGDALIACAPERLPDLYRGSPALIAARLRPGGGTLRVRGRTAQGEWSETVQVPAIEPGEGAQALAALYARETVEDLELDHAAGRRDVDARIEELGLAFQISTRLTTWVAISQEITVDPSSPTRRELVPQELPYGVSAEGLGLRGAQVPAPTGAGAPMPEARMMNALQGAPGFAPARPAAPRASARMTKSSVLGESAKDDDGLFEPAKERTEAPFPDEEAGEMARGRVSLPSPRRLRARVRLVEGGRVVLEVAIDGPLDWAPTAEVEVELADGTRRTAKVVTEKSTRAGRLAAGQSARLVLAIDAAPARVFLGGLEIEVT